MRIIVLFEPQQVNLIKSILTKDCVVIGHNLLLPKDVKCIKPALNLDLDKKHAVGVGELFDNLERSTPFSGMKGFANNFYECTIAPLAAYVCVLDNLIRELRRAGEAIEVWFPSKYVVLQRSSAYFMAEHESQGVRLYSREATFLPYLVDLCKYRRIKPLYLKRRLGLIHIFFRELRIYAVLFFRVLKMTINNMFTTSRESLAQEGVFDLMATSRSVMQSDFLYSFLKQSSLSSLILATESFVGQGQNKILLQRFTKDSHIKQHTLPIKKRVAWLYYQKIIGSLLFKIKQEYPIAEGVSIKLHHALSEVLVMWPDLMVYRDTLYSSIKRLPTPRIKLLLSTEQKSPYAYADAWVANECQLVCAHAMQCDQHARALPFPVFGNFFLADTKMNQDAFIAAWGIQEKFVKYIGSFKACSKTYSQQTRHLETWCFFSQAVSFDANRSVLKSLRVLKNQTRQKIFLKCHPRDNIKRYSAFFDVVNTHVNRLSKLDLFLQFDFGITFPSGVVTDLLYLNKPFLLLRFRQWTEVSLPYFDDDYDGNVYDIDDLIQKILNPAAWQGSFQAYRERYFRKNRIIKDVDAIQAALSLLQYE